MEIDLQTISDHMKVAFKARSLCTGENGLGINLEKTKLVLFTRVGQELVLSGQAKYLEVISNYH